jgi:hypothetical protein
MTAIFDSWAKYITDILNQESELAGSILKHGGELGDARESLISGVLQRIIPGIYEIGTGEIVDYQNNHSKQIDIIIARKDFPSLLLPSGSKVYLVESVLATIEVKNRLNSETLPQAIIATLDIRKCLYPYQTANRTVCPRIRYFS